MYEIVLKYDHKLNFDRFQINASVPSSVNFVIITFKFKKCLIKIIIPNI